MTDYIMQVSSEQIVNELWDEFNPTLKAMSWIKKYISLHLTMAEMQEYENLPVWIHRQKFLTDKTLAMIEANKWAFDKII